MHYFNLDQLLSKIDDPYQSRCRNFYHRHQHLFETSKGSKIKHQAWEGGYLDHIMEVMNIACVTYDALNQCRALPFSLSDALLCLYLHDIEKLWIHAWRTEDRMDKEGYYLNPGQLPRTKVRGLEGDRRSMIVDL